MKKFKLLITMVVSFLILTLFSSNIVKATTTLDLKENSEEMALATEAINSFEKDQDIDVIKELNKYLDELKRQLEQVKEEEKKQIVELIIGVEDSISNFEEFKNTQDLPLKESEINSSSVLPLPIIHTRAAASAAVASTIAYFKANGYNLSAELLTHARSNKVVDSSYRPTSFNTKQIKNTTIFKNLITYIHSSSDRFTSNNSNKDLYYSIHKFNYSVSGNGSSRVMSINDRYDFDSNSVYPPSLGGIMINWMVIAQDLGVIKPYKLYITTPRY